MHPKIGSTLGSRRRVRAAGKPSDEPRRKGETQSLTDFEPAQARTEISSTDYDESRDWTRTPIKRLPVIL